MERQIMLKDGSIKQVAHGTTVAQVAASIHAGLAKQAVGGKLDGVLLDISHSLEQDGKLDIVTLDDAEGLEMMRHSTAHVMAQALQRLFGAEQVKLGIGPVIADGFYYDVDLAHRLTNDDLARVEREMQRIIEEKLPFVRQVVSREEALRLFTQRDDRYKLELIRDLPDDAVITLYSQGEFTDLCRGPHVPTTGHIKAFRLLHVAGAYWRGQANNPVMQRIYGTAFAKQADLEAHLHRLEEAKKRDHRKLGKELGLFLFSDEAPGMPFYLPKGMAIRNELEQFSREQQRRLGYREVRTPLMMNQRLWQQSGHWDHYKDNMYVSEVDDQMFSLKPMNCPGHLLIYKSERHSYRDLPIRLAEFGQVHRHEYSGALSGMMRVRTFCQDDAHIFARPDQIAGEIGRAMELIDRMYAVFGFESNIELSTRPESFMGEEQLWDKAEAALQNVLEEKGVPYTINEGDGAFYGPKIDFHILDALGRSWQCGTIQLDFQMPEKFDLTYIGEDNQKHRPVLIHRAIFGSIDRFIGILTEHYSGAFPLWLAPVQVKILPVADRFLPDAERVQTQLEEAGIRVETDQRAEKLGYKIREAQLEKVPYMFIIGEQESANGSVAVRHREEGDIGSYAVEAILEQIQAAVAGKQSQNQ